MSNKPKQPNSIFVDELCTFKVQAITYPSV